MRRGGDGPDYIRKTVDKARILRAITRLERRAEWLVREPSGYGARLKAEGIRDAIDMLEQALGLLEGHPSRGWW